MTTRPPIDERAGFLLGAGASFQLGMPLVTHLTSLFKAFYNDHQLQRIAKGRLNYGEPVPPAVMDCVREALGRNDMHYEAVLGRLQTESRRLGQANDLLQEFYGFYSQMVEAVYLILLDRQIEMRRYLAAALSPYEGLMAFANASAPMFVFSLNHDLMVEVIADRLALPVKDGFHSDQALAIGYGAHQDASFLQADILSEKDLASGNLDLFRHGQRGINLLKLHGALDVFAFREGLDLCRLRRSGPGMDGILEPLRIVNRDVAPWLNHADGRVVNNIMYVDSDDEIQFLRRSLLAGAHKFDKRHSQTVPQAMLEIFRSQINHVRHLYAVGYAFGDPHVDLVLREWLERLSERRLFVVDPYRTQMPGHFAHLLPQISIEQCTAAQFFASFRKEPLSWGQDLAFHIREATRSRLEARMQARYSKRFGRDWV